MTDHDPRTGPASSPGPDSAQGPGFSPGPDSAQGPGFSSGPDSSPGPDTAARTPWQRYIDLIRALDAERAAEEARTANQRQGAEAAALEVERLAPLLIDQGAELSHLARRLRISPPRLSAQPVADADLGPYELVVQATRLTARAGSYAREAHALGTRARFLPAAPAGFRNFVIYLLWALAGLGVQYGIVSADSSASMVVVLIVVPLVAYVGGLISVSALGRAPLAVDRPGRSARMGALICFGIFPFGLLAFVLRSVFG
jgi:hypothetical protein